jgi:hypothetical protein
MARILFRACVLMVLGTVPAAWAQQANCHAAYMAQSDQYRREVPEAAFQCPETAGVPAVPPTVARTDPATLGSLFHGEKPPAGALTSPYHPGGP